MPLKDEVIARVDHMCDERTQSTVFDAVR